MYVHSAAKSEREKKEKEDEGRQASRQPPIKMWRRRRRRKDGMSSTTERKKRKESQEFDGKKRKRQEVAKKPLWGAGLSLFSLSFTQGRSHPSSLLHLFIFFLPLQEKKPLRVINKGKTKKKREKRKREKERKESHAHGVLRGSIELSPSIETASHIYASSRHWIPPLESFAYIVHFFILSFCWHLQMMF